MSSSKKSGNTDADSSAVNNNADPTTQFLKDLLAVFKLKLQQSNQYLIARKIIHTITDKDEVIKRLIDAKKMVILSGDDVYGDNRQFFLPESETQSLSRRRSDTFTCLSESEVEKNSQKYFDKELFYKDPRPFFSMVEKILKVKNSRSDASSVGAHGGGNKIASLISKLSQGSSSQTQSHQRQTQSQQSQIPISSLFHTESKLLRHYREDLYYNKNWNDKDKSIFCKGDIWTWSCVKCKKVVSDSHEVKKLELAVLNFKVPHCDCSNLKRPSFQSFCSEDSPQLNLQSTAIKFPAIIKPDIKFIKDPNLKYVKALTADKKLADFLIVISSNCNKVPTNKIPLMMPKTCPQILINKNSIDDGLYNFDVEFLGDVEIILSFLIEELDSFQEKAGSPKPKKFKETKNVFETVRDRKCYFIDNELVHKRYIFNGCDEKIVRELYENRVCEIKDFTTATTRSSLVKRSSSCRRASRRSIKINDVVEYESDCLVGDDDEGNDLGE